MSIHEGRVPIQQTTIDYVSFGRGTIPLVLIPGLNLREINGSGSVLSFLYRDFGRQYRVYCIDRRKEVPEGYTIRQIADDTAFVMEALGIQGAYVLGISQGGMVAQYLALEHPALVSKLVIACSLCRPNDAFRTHIQRWATLAKRKAYSTLGMAFLTEIYSPAYVKKYKPLFQVLTKKFAPGKLDRFLTLIQASLTGDTYDRLPEIRCPAFVIGGALDQVTTPEASREMAQQLRCPLYLYESLGHSAFQEGRDFNQRVLDFFSGDTL